MNYRKKLYVLIALLSLWVIFAGGIAIGTFALGPALTMAAAPAATAGDGEGQYLRGLYDVCRVVLHGPENDCMRAVAQAHEKHWYDQASPGWSWPLGGSSTP